MPFYFWETSTILFQTYLLSHLNRMTLPQLYCLHLEFYNYHSPLNRSQIMTTRQTGGLLAPIRGSYRPAPKDAGFHFVQALMPLTRRSP